MSEGLSGREAAERSWEGIMEGLREAAELVLTDAVINAPFGGEDDQHPPGLLKESGHIEEWEEVVQVVFDATVPGDEQSYAAKQHEALHFEHPHGGGPKFLENAVKLVAPHLDEIVAGKVHALLAAPPKRQRGR